MCDIVRLQNCWVLRTANISCIKTCAFRNHPMKTKPLMVNPYRGKDHRQFYEMLQHYPLFLLWREEGRITVRVVDNKVTCTLINFSFYTRPHMQRAPTTTVLPKRPLATSIDSLVVIEKTYKKKKRHLSDGIKPTLTREDTPDQASPSKEVQVDPRDANITIFKAERRGLAHGMEVWRRKNAKAIFSCSI